jgi:hypothetical protein
MLNLWKKHTIYGFPKAVFQLGTVPAVHDNTVLLQWWFPFLRFWAL